MAELRFVFHVRGSVHASLPVEITAPAALVEGDTATIDGLGTLIVEFSVRNPLDREVSFPDIMITTSGPGVEKLTPSLESNVMVIASGSILENKLIVEANEALLESDLVTIDVKGEEG